MPNFPYYGLGPWDGSPCDTLNIDNPAPEAAFEYTQDSLGQQLELFDASHYAYEWVWSFGDGSPISEEQDPVHTYAEPGAYEVCLYVSNVTGEDTYCETIYAGVSSSQEVFVSNLQVTVSPNPFQEQFQLRIDGLENQLSQQIQLRVYDVTGRLLYQCQVGGPDNYRDHTSWLEWVETGHWPKGLYFYELLGSTLQPLATGKIVKQ